MVVARRVYHVVPGPTPQEAAAPAYYAPRASPQLRLHPAPVVSCTAKVYRFMA
jgi:hypothetical protein